MKKILILITLVLSSLVIKSQGLIITDVITMADSDTASLIYVTIKPDLINVSISKSVTYNLLFYRNKLSYQLGYQTIPGLSFNQLTVTFTSSDIIKNSGVTLGSDVNLFMYNKLKSELLIQKSLNSVIQ